MPASLPIAQAGTIPFRREQGRVEFCLITSARTGKWGFPKGIVDPGESPEQTALKEAREEAGLCGRIIGSPLGSYRYQKSRALLDVTVFLMEVDRVDLYWLEAGVRQRRWEPYAAAASLLCRQPLRDLLAEAHRRLSHNGR